MGIKVAPRPDRRSSSRTRDFFVSGQVRNLKSGDRSMRHRKLKVLAVTLAAAGAWGAVSAQQPQAPTPPLTAAEKEQAKKVYFERCAGCHGVLRKGATGKNLEPHWTRKLPDGTVQEAARSSSAPGAWRRSSATAPTAGWSTSTTS
jgi:mono/diheme cytochrome c family protein